MTSQRSATPASQRTTLRIRLRGGGRAFTAAAETLIGPSPSPHSGNRRGRRRAPEQRKPPGLFDRAEKAVVIDPDGRGAVAPDERAGDDRGHASAATLSVPRARLVEDDEHDAAPKLTGAQERAGERGEPTIPGPYRAVVHVVTEIGDDEREARQPVRFQVSPE